MSDSSDSSEEFSERDLFEDLPPRIHAVPVMKSPFACSNCDTEKATLSIYDRALFVAPDETDTEVLSSVVLFNLGLINNIRGIRRGRSKSFRKALRFYKMSCDVLVQGRKEHSAVGLLLLAIFNNTAHVYAYLLDVEKTRQCLECLRDILSNAFEASDDEYLIFYMNSLMTPGRAISLAPAA